MQLHTQATKRMYCMYVFYVRINLMLQIFVELICFKKNKQPKKQQPTLLVFCHRIRLNVWLKVSHIYLEVFVFVFMLS